MKVGEGTESVKETTKDVMVSTNCNDSRNDGSSDFVTNNDIFHAEDWNILVDLDSIKRKEALLQVTTKFFLATNTDNS